MKHYNVLMACLAAGFLLSACESGTNVSKALGLQKEAPDEFLVISRPPLTVPPEFNLVPPQDPSSTSTSRVREEAEAALFSQNKKRNAVKSSAEKVLLGQARTMESNPNIRDVLAEETALRNPGPADIIEEEEEEGFFSGFFSDSKEKDPIIDPVAERERILTNEQAGKEITDGETPTIDREPESVLDRILD